MKKISKFQRFISLAFVAGFVSCLLSMPIAFVSPDTARFLFFGGGSIGLVSLIYTMIKGVYIDELP